MHWHVPIFSLLFGFNQLQCYFNQCTWGHYNTNMYASTRTHTHTCSHTCVQTYNTHTHSCVHLSVYLNLWEYYKFFLCFLIWWVFFLWMQIPYFQFRENNWTLNTCMNGKWNVRYDLWSFVIIILPRVTCQSIANPFVFFSCIHYISCRSY